MEYWSIRRRKSFNGVKTYRLGERLILSLHY